MIIRNIRNLSVASVVTLGVGMAPMYAHAQVQSNRTALANCIAEATFSATAAIISEAIRAGGSCDVGIWEFDLLIPGVEREPPLGGDVVVYNDQEEFIISGNFPENAAQTLPDDAVQCEARTVGSDNTFSGERFTYASGTDNYYTDNTYRKFKSRGNINIGEPGAGPMVTLRERDRLHFGVDNGSLVASGDLDILERSGQSDVLLREWEVEEWEQGGGEFSAEFITFVNGYECEIEIEGEITNAPDFKSIVGILEVELELEEEEEEEE